MTMLVVVAEPGDADSMFVDARATFPKNPQSAIALLGKAAAMAHVGAQKMLGIAYVEGHGVEPSRERAIEWFREAAAQGDDEAAYNLCALCEARPPCVKGEVSTDEDAVSWLRSAGGQGMAEASFQAGVLEFGLGRSADALDRFREAALSASDGHPSAAFNAAHILARRVEGGSAKELSAALGWFGRALRAARAVRHSKVEADAIAALWVWAQESELEQLTRIFTAARELDSVLSASPPPPSPPPSAAPAEVEEEEGLRLLGWQQAAALWADFEAAYAIQPSPRNEEAMRPMRQALQSLESLLGSANLGEFRRHLVLSKLVQGSKMLTQDDAGMRRAIRWHVALVDTALCAGLFARDESSPSCFNDQLVASITMRRRLNDTSGAEALVALGRAHPSAATHWHSSVQTPRVFHPQLTARPWWDRRAFVVASALEAAWASGAIATDIARLGLVSVGAGEGEVVGEGIGFERMRVNGEQVRAASAADDLGGGGAWSEFKLFDGVVWDDGRCELAATLCALLRSHPEVSGTVRGVNGELIKQQGEVTIYKLLPGAHILPHVGVTNRALVLHFPLVGIEGVRFRVADEWRTYEEGQAMVFDDSFEHEVVHGGLRDRYVLFAVLHHPELGSPTLGGQPPSSDAAKRRAKVEPL